MLLLAALAAGPAAAYQFNFSKAHGNHMVLQQAPYHSVIWGFGNAGAAVLVQSTAFPDTVQTHVGTDNTWRATLPLVVGSTKPYTITAVSQGTSIQLTDVLFGDVWICSGQSNMQMTVSSAYNATDEAQRANNYPQIRVMTATLIESPTPLVDFESLNQNWSVASASSIGGPAWDYFSATCWFFGRNLADNGITTPIGLIATTWGGTYIQAWSSPDALKQCPGSLEAAAVTHAAEEAEAAFGSPKGPNPNQPSVLWNAMVVPLLKTTVKGAIWYQGEANCGGQANLYACQFPAMIADWRAKWAQVNNNTNKVFPFGFVQLSTWGDNDTTNAGPVPVVRWGQSANHGFVPNVEMPATFMAVAVDLSDPKSPVNEIHPRNKQAVGNRLARGALSVAYGRNTYWTGPQVQVIVWDSTHGTIQLSFYNYASGITARVTDGFEVCGNGDACAITASDVSGKWYNASVIGTTASTVTLKPSTSGKWTTLRYLWRQAPCTPLQGEGLCAIYAADLPLAPFILPITGQ